MATTVNRTSETVAAAVADARLEGIDLDADAVSILDRLDAGHLDANAAGRELLARHNITAPAGHPFA